MNFIKEFIEFFWFSKYPYFEYVLEVIICVYFTVKFFKNTQFSYDKCSKLKTLLLVIFKSLIVVLIVNITYEFFVEPIALEVFNISGLPIVFKPLLCFVALSRLEELIYDFYD